MSRASSGASARPASVTTLALLCSRHCRASSAMMHQRGADARDLVRRDRHADAVAADEDAAVERTGRDALGDPPREVRVVHRPARMGAEVDAGVGSRAAVTRALDCLLDARLERHAMVVGAERNVHALILMEGRHAARQALRRAPRYQDGSSWRERRSDDSRRDRRTSRSSAATAARDRVTGSLRRRSSTSSMRRRSASLSRSVRASYFATMPPQFCHTACRRPQARPHLVRPDAECAADARENRMVCLGRDAPYSPCPSAADRPRPARPRSSSTRAASCRSAPAAACRPSPRSGAP